MSHPTVQKEKDYQQIKKAQVGGQVRRATLLNPEGGGAEGDEIGGKKKNCFLLSGLGYC